MLFRSIFALGVLFGIVRVRTRSLWPTMVAHACHNLLAVLLAEQVGLLGASWQGWALGALGVVVAFATGRRRHS